MILTLLMSLAAYRVWRLLALDDLPPLVKARTRFQDAIAERHGDDWADGIACPFCSGFWVSLVVVVVTASIHPVPLPALQVLAVSAIVGFLGMKLED